MVGGEWMRSGRVGGHASESSETGPAGADDVSKMGAGIACLAITSPAVPSVCPSMQQAGGAVRQPVLQQSWPFAPSGPMGMKHSPFAAMETNAAASTRAATRR